MRPYVLALCLSLGALVARAAPSPPVSEPDLDPGALFTLVNAGAGIPQGGALLFEGPYDVTLSAVRVLSSAGTQSHAGTLTAIEGSPFWVWRPDEPLPIGILDAEVGAPTALAKLTPFEVVPAIALAQPELMFSASASLISAISSSRCCRTRVNSSATLIETSQCFGVESESSIQVEPGVFTAASQLLANQYLFRFSAGPGARATFTAGSFRNLVLPIYREQADEYCFEVSAIELPTLRELSYEGLDTCAEHGALAALGMAPIEPSDAQLSRVLCPAPPEGYEDIWCDANADCSDEEAACQLFAHVCEGEPLAPISPGGGSPSGGDDDGGGGDGDGDGDEGAAMNGSARDGGCAVSAGRRVAGLSDPVGLGALIALALAGRRRRSFGSKCAKPGRGQRLQDNPQASDIR